MSLTKDQLNIDKQAFNQLKAEYFGNLNNSENGNESIMHDSMISFETEKHSEFEEDSVDNLFHHSYGKIE